MATMRDKEVKAGRLPTMRRDLIFMFGLVTGQKYVFVCVSEKMRRPVCISGKMTELVSPFQKALQAFKWSYLFILLPYCQKLIYDLPTSYEYLVLVVCMQVVVLV
jgi:hypothetical protein